MRGLFSCTLFAMCFASFGLAADALTEEQNTALQKSLDFYEATYWEPSAGQLKSTSSPKILLASAQQWNMDVEQLKAFMAQQQKSLIENTSLVSFEIDREAATVSFTQAGRPYLLFPASRELMMSGRSFPLNFEILAFEDEAAWFLYTFNRSVSGHSQRLRILRAAYPDFENVPNANFTILNAEIEERKR